ncbi:hypothetical protein As57867_003791, partial [Aphanomyces stellatus]
FWTLVGVVLGCNLLCFVGTKYVVLRKNKPSPSIDSLLLSTGAKYLFLHDHRIHNDIYYLDRASAALNGMLTLCVRGHLFMLDFKMWRLVAINRPDASEFPSDNPFVEEWRRAVPLTD